MNFSDLGIETNGKTSGQMKTKCPKCIGDRKNKSDKSLSVDFGSGLYNCHYCGWCGTANNSLKSQEVPQKKTFSVPEYNNTPLSEKSLKWLVSVRGISKATILRFRITESVEFMPQVSEKRNCLNFNYFRNEKLVNIKFRDGEKNFKLSKDAELIFYNLDSIKDIDYCVITEGELDCMAVYEATCYPVVSVPNGASKGSQKLEYLDNCYSYFEDKKSIILAVDGDSSGLSLRDELARRLGKERVKIVNYPNGCKDANEVLLKHGKEALKEMIDSALEYPLEGVFTLADLDEQINSFWSNGYPRGYESGCGELDKYLTFRKGDFTCVTGIPGSGKSEMVDYITVNLAKNHKWIWAYCSFENEPALHLTKLMEKHTGKAFDYRKNPYDRMNIQQASNAKLFINDHFYLMDIDNENLTIDGILAKTKELVIRKGINGLVIDPYNYIEHQIEKGQSETQYISQLLTKIKRFCKINDVHIILIAHPTKLKKEKGKYEVPTLYHISGSAHFFNKTDNGFTVYRDFETNIVDVHVQKVRHSFLGKIGMCSFNYNTMVRQYESIN